MERFSSRPGCLVIWVFSSSKLSPFAEARFTSSLESRASSYRATVSSSSCISLNFIPFSSTQALRTAFNSPSLMMPSPSLGEQKIYGCDSLIGSEVKPYHLRRRFGRGIGPSLRRIGNKIVACLHGIQQKKYYLIRSYRKCRRLAWRKTASTQYWRRENNYWVIFFFLHWILI